MSTPISARGPNGSPVPLKATDDGLLEVSPSNINTKFRDSYEYYTPGLIYDEVRAAGDIIETEGNAIASSWLDFSLDPLTAGTESSITTKETFSMPMEVAIGLSMSQRTVGQEFSVEVVSDEEPLPVQPDIAIASITHANGLLTINTVDDHGLVAGKCIGTHGVPDSRLNYPALVVASAPTPRQITVTAGPMGNLGNIVAGPFTSGSIYFRSRLGYAQDGVSEIFENASATNASIYFRSDSGDSLPSGTAAANHSATIGTTASVQPINSPGVYAFQATTEFGCVIQADRVQFTHLPIDGSTQSTNILSRRQVIPNPKKKYKYRIRGTNNKALTVPIGEIVSVTKTGTSTATVVLNKPHNLVAADLLVGYGPRDATNYPALITATAITAIVNPTTVQVAWGPTANAVSYGGYLAKVQGGNLMSALGGIAQAVQSAAVSTLTDGTRVLTLVGSASWAGFLIGDRMNGIGIRNIVNGASLGVDGVYRVRNIATTTVELVPVGGTTLPADFSAVNCGGALIKRTSLRLHHTRIFDYERHRVEFLARPSGDLSQAVPVVLQGGATQTGTWNVGLNAGTQAIGTVGIANGQGAEDATAAGNAVRTGGRVRTNHPTTFVAGDAADVTMTTGLAQVVRPYSVPEADVTYSGLLTTTGDVVIQVAAGAGLKRHVTSLWMINTGAALVDFILKDGTTERERYPLPVNVPVPVLFPTGATLTANTALNGALSAAGTVRVIVKGYTAP